MQEPKYYDYTNDRPLDLEADGCPLAEWHLRYGQARFAKHPRGFRVFLPPAGLERADEYAEADPYRVEQSLENPFHKRRLELTIALVQQAVAPLQRAPRILDLGCGLGFITEAVRRAVPGGEFTGLDHSVTAIQYAHEHWSDIDFAVADARDAPYAREYFDVVICNNLWEHLPDPLRLLERVYQILKPAGHVVLSTPSRYHFDNLMRALWGKPLVFLSSHHVTEYTVGQVIEQLAYGGFRVETILSRPIPTGRWTRRLLRKLIGMWLRLVGSHHRLENSAFYLARKLLDGEP